MKVVINLPDALMADANGRVRFELQTEGDTVAAVLASLRHEMPGVYRRVVTEQGEVRQHINIFVGDESIRWTGGLDTRIGDGEEVHVIPAVSGGTMEIIASDPGRRFARPTLLLSPPPPFRPV